MSAPIQDTQNVENKPTDKELNFRALEAKYKRELEQERAARLEAERKAQEADSKKNLQAEEDDYEPYVNKQRLEQKFSNFEKQMDEKIDKRAEEKARMMIDHQKKENWLKNNQDFYDVMQHADKLMHKDPELAESILEMPDTFERQKLVYKNIKAFGVHKPEVKQPSIQEKIDANRKSPYYQPSGVGTAPYAQVGDFSDQGQKQAYEKMKQLQKQLRL